MFKLNDWGKLEWVFWHASCSKSVTDEEIEYLVTTKIMLKASSKEI